MKKFLEYVAEDIINKYGTNLSKIAVVFPNKRASIFLNEQLAIKAGRPLWSPVYITISDFFRQHSSLLIGDPIKLICEIHKSFTECTGINESLDHFYGWGQLLLADFDDIDKNMADASNVFKNIKDIHELDDISYLTDEQKEILHKFFSNFTADNKSELKKRFLKLWCHFEDIYNNYKERLRKQNIAYEGMLYRDVAQQDINYKYDKYLFIGFNMVHKVEQIIFSNLQKKHKAGFYWDFDSFYMPPNANEAGHYIAKYLKDFPNEFDLSDKSIYNNLSSDKKIIYANASTENIQARYVSDWLKEEERYKYGKNTAIVLCDESLLPTIIHCIPKEVESVNITSGYPLFQTPISSFVLQLLNLKLKGYSHSKDRYQLCYVTQILSHPYSQYISDKCSILLNELKEKKIYYPTLQILNKDEFTRHLFEVQNNNSDLMQWLMDILKRVAINSDNTDKDPLFQESIFRMYTLCNRLNELIKSGDLDVDVITLHKLIIQLISSNSIPFHGEPAEGIQIMGILETRNLDFDHILILSCNEGNMPKGITDSSFIPYSIRKAYDLTTVDNKVAIYAYYFYNLIQRTSDVTIVYNNSTEDGHTGEMSRFMLQLMTDSNFNIKRLFLKTNQQLIYSKPNIIAKNEAIMNLMDAMKFISPTSINRYMRCPLQFYYYNIAQIKEFDKDDEMDNRMFGNIFHGAAEILYRKYLNAENIIITKEIIDKVLKDKSLIERIVDEAFTEIYFKQEYNGQNKSFYNGLQLINREVIIRYLKRLIEIDSTLAPFTIIGIEKDVYEDITFIANGDEHEICIGGRIDRMDKIVDTENNIEKIRIVDYKTGNGKLKEAKSIDDIFQCPLNTEIHADYYLQIMLYSAIVQTSKKYNRYNLPVSPALFFIQQSSEEKYNPIISINKNRINDISTFIPDFHKRIKIILSEMFNKEIPFKPTINKRTCESCPYSCLCGG